MKPYFKPYPLKDITNPKNKKTMRRKFILDCQASNDLTRELFSMTSNHNGGKANIDLPLIGAYITATNARRLSSEQYTTKQEDIHKLHIFEGEKLVLTIEEREITPLSVGVTGTLEQHFSNQDF